MSSIGVHLYSILELFVGIIVAPLSDCQSGKKPTLFSCLSIKELF